MPLSFPFRFRRPAVTPANLERLAAMLSLRSGYFVVTSTEVSLASTAVEYAISCVSTYRVVRLLATADRSHTELCVVAGLELPKSEDRPVTAVRDALRALVVESRAAGRPVIVIVDGCDEADPNQLEWIRGVLEWDPDVIGDLRVILFGSQQLTETLDDRRVRALATRVALRVFVPPVPRKPGTGARARRSMLARTIRASAVVVGVLATVSLYGRAPELRAYGPGDSTRPERARTATASSGHPTASATHARVAAVPVLARSPVLPAQQPQRRSSAASVQPAAAVRRQTAHAGGERRTVARSLPSRRQPSRPSLVLQVGSFGSSDNAIELKNALSARYENVHIAHAEIAGRTFSRVRVGPFPESSKLVEVEAELLRLGYSPLRILTRGSRRRSAADSPDETVPSG